MELTRIRASSLPELFDCPARWEAKNLRGIRLPSGSASALGTAVHAGTAAFDQSRLDNNPVTADEAAGAVVDAIYAPHDDVVWDADCQPRDAEKIGIALHKLYCKEIAPKQEYVAVEALCESLDIPELGIRLTGTTDRITYSELDGYGIADIKTGKRAVGTDGSVHTKGHAAQIAVYELLAWHALGQVMEAPAQIIGLQVAKTDKGRRAGIGTLQGARELVVGTDEQPGLLQYASNMIKSGSFYGNTRSVLCTSAYCPIFRTCQWRK